MNMSEHPIIKILLVDDHPVVQQGLRTTLTSYPQFEIVGEVPNGLDAVQFLKKKHADVVLMDIIMPTMNGIQATKIIQNEIPEVKVLALTMHDEKEYVVEMIKAGATGYLLKDAKPNELIQAIDTVYQGNVYFSPMISNILVKELIAKPEVEKTETSDILSSRELEVLRLVAEGSSNKIIADQLFISVRTVETHRERIMKKLNLHNTASLTIYAVQKGLIKVK